MLDVLNLADGKKLLPDRVPRRDIPRHIAVGERQFYNGRARVATDARREGKGCELISELTKPQSGF